MKLDQLKKIEERRILNDKIKIQRFCNKMSLTEMRRVLKEVKRENKVSEFKNLIKALMIKYEYDYKFLEDMISEACPGRGKK